VIESVATSGYCAGMAFQIVDDLLDVEGDGDLTGKPIGIDLKDGNPSLPLVMAIQRDAEVRRIFEKQEPTAQEIHVALEKVRRSGVLAEGQRMARSYGQQALAALENLEPSSYYDSLVYFTQQLVDRIA
jgi:geranylgeranyl pyrophosphate synthase